MKTNGYKLREGLRAWKYRQEIARKQFKENLFRFEQAKEGEDPISLGRKILEADHGVCRVQELQQLYNSKVNLEDGTTLAYAVKMVSFAGEAEKRWKSASTDSGRDRWSSRELTRRADEEHAVKQVSLTDAVAEAERQSRYASTLREQIALANNTEIDLEISKDEALILFGESEPE